MSNDEAHEYFWTVARTEPTRTDLWSRFMRLVGIQD